MNLINIGSPTGLCDSDGRMIKVGDLIRRPVDVNTDFHGAWALHRVNVQGIVPILSYVRSEKGKKLPEGYTASCLSDCYDQKMFVFATDVSEVRPMEELKVIDETPNSLCPLKPKTQD